MPHKSKKKKESSSDEVDEEELEDEVDEDEESDEEGSDEEGSDESGSDESGSDEDNESDSDETGNRNRKKQTASLAEFKKASLSWLDCDDRIKELNGLMKEQKDEKKELEKKMLALMERCGLKEQKIDITDKDGKIRARVACQKSVTKSSIKDDQLKAALMEILQSERRTDQALKKVESKRKVNERWYLKRTNGNAGEGKKRKQKARKARR